MNSHFRRRGVHGGSLAWRAAGLGVVLLCPALFAPAAANLHFDKVLVEEVSSPDDLFDGTVEPGETVRVILSFLNLGDETAVGVAGTLTTSSPEVIILTDRAGCGDLEVDELVSCTAPAFEVEVAAAVACGQVLEFEAAMEMGGGPGPVVPFSLRVGRRRPVVLTDPVRLTDEQRIQIPYGVLAAGGEWGLVWEDPRLISYEVYVEVLEGDGTQTEGNKQVSTRPDLSRYPYMAWDGQGYGVVWVDERNGVLGRDTFFAYVDGRGNVQVEREIHSSPALIHDDPPKIAWDGEAFGIVSTQEDAASEDVWLLRVDSQGDPLAPLRILRTVEIVDNGSRALVHGWVWDGSQYVLFLLTIASNDDDWQREVHFLDREGNPRRDPTIYSCSQEAQSEGGYWCAGKAVWSGRGFGTVVEARDERLRWSAYFQRLDALGRPDGKAARVTEPEVTTPWHEGSDLEEWSPHLAWDGYGWGVVTGRLVREHADRDCDGIGDPDCECFIDLGPCNAGHQMWTWTDERGRRLVEEIPLNPPSLAQPGGYVEWQDGRFGTVYIESIGASGCFPGECGDLDFRLLGTEAWCPGPPPGEIRSPGPSEPSLRLERVGGRDLKLLWAESGPEATSYNVYRGANYDRGDGLRAGDLFYNHSPYRFWDNGGFRPACHLPGEVDAPGWRSLTMEGAVCNPSWPVWPECPYAMVYYLVSASNGEGEGPLGYDSEGRERAPERKVCLGDL